MPALRGVPRHNPHIWLRLALRALGLERPRLADVGEDRSTSFYNSLV